MTTTMKSLTDNVAMIGNGMMKVKSHVVLIAVFIFCTAVVAESAIVNRIGTYSTSVTAGNNATLNYTVPAGSNRVVVISFGSENSTGTITNINVTYGGQAIPVIAQQGDGGTGYNNYTWVGYCDESCIAASGGESGAIITVSHGGTVNAIVIAAATYENVEQSAPVYASNSATSGSSPINTSVNTIDNARVIFAVNFNGGTNSLNAISGWTEGFDVPGGNGAAADSHSFALAERDATTASTPVNITATAAAASSRTNIVAFSLQETLCTPTTGPVAMNAGGNKNGSLINVCDLINLNGATLTNVTIMNGATEYYNGGSCSNIPTTIGDGAPVDWTDATLDISASADDDCGTSSNDSTTFNFTTCVSSTGPLQVTDGFVLSGTSTDLTAHYTTNGATVGNIQVWEIAGVGNDIDELESFEGGGGVGWDPDNWVATIEDGATPQNNPPQNGDLMTDIGTRSPNTGPGSSLNGAFLFYEASQAASHTDRYLVNQNIYDAGNNDLSVEFMYNLNGVDIGTLELQVRNPNYNGGAWTSEWALSGNQGDSWDKAIVDLRNGSGLSGTSYVAGNTELRFRFVYGGGPYGDIAIDKVRIIGPRQATTKLFDDDDPTPNANDPAAAATDGSGPFPVWPEGTVRIDLTGQDNCGAPLGDYGFGTFVADYSKPIVTSFSMPSSGLSPVQVYSLAATDNIAVTGYMITESATPPNAGAAGWSATPPLKVVPSGTGSITFYAWAKDGAGNVSNHVPGTTDATVTVNPDVTAPTVTAFTLPASSFSPISVLTLTASDDSGEVTGYMVTEVGVDADPAGAADPRWQASPPSSLSTGSSGNRTFRAWAKDATGNISTHVEATVDVIVDVNPPVVSFSLPANHDALSIPVTLSAVDTTGGAGVNTGVAAYMITTSATPPNAGDAGWTHFPPTELVVTGDGSYDFWAWAKDNADNVSAGVQQTVLVALPASCDYDVSSAAPGGAVYIDAEHFTNATAPNPWVMDVVTGTLADSNGDTNDGTGYLSTTTGGTGSQPNGSRHDYPINFPSGGTYCIWIRALDQTGAGGGDSTFWGVDGNYVGAMTQAADNQWAWSNGTQNGAACTTISAGPHTINLWPREAGQKTDAFILTTDTGATAGGLFSGNNDENTRKADLEAAGVKVVDPTCVDSGGGGGPGGGGGGSGYIHIPDGQSVSGTSVDTEALFDTDLSLPLQYRALGGQTDGFNAFAVDPKWFHTNVGNEPLLGGTTSMEMDGDSFKLAGSGADIWNNNDFFAYHYQPNVSGDFTIDVKITALVDSQTGTNTNQNVWAKAGIMVRQSLNSNSRHAMIVATPGNGIRMQYRPTDGATSQNPSANQGGAAGPDTWLRLVRQGNTFTGYFSTDNGLNWTLSASGQVSMQDPVNIGLAVTSHNTARDSIATFDNFLFMPASTSGMTTSWSSTAVPVDTTQPAAWTAGTYGLAVRGDTGGSSYVYQANTFNFDPCVDLTPSTISVHSGATVGGPAVSLADLFDHTGNVGSFSYQINGVDVNNPWNSYSVVPDGNTGSVTLRVNGVDPDCGGTTLSDTALINIDNLCTDPDPSTITILTGQAVGGASVDLTRLFTSTGDVAVNGFTYKINGVQIGDPTNWDSRAYGNGAAESVILEVHGIDPDCNNGISAVNNIIVDNTCVRNPPSINFDHDIGHVGAGRAIPYIVTIRNEDSYNCGPSTFDVTIASETNGSDFVPSYFNPPGSNLNITLQGREHADIELAVEAVPGAVEWNSNTTTLDVDCQSGMPEHPTQSKSVTTKVFLVSPITHNSVTTGSSRWSGNWGTSEPGSKYGNFDCLTCHDKGGPNIKWMRNEITTPDGSNWEGAGTPTVGITLKDARPGAEIYADGDPDNTVFWGDDDWDGADDLLFDLDGPQGPAGPTGDAQPGAGRVTSDRVCEVCHSTTWYHRYDTQAIPNVDGVTWNQEGRIDPTTLLPVGNDGLKHFPDRDCTDCHRHELGFTASCTGCHGDPPLEATLGGPNGLADIPAPTGSVTPGTHYKHTVVLGFPCEYCHAGWRNVGEMPREIAGKQDINHLFNVFYDLDMSDPVKDNGHYTGQDGVSYEGVVIPAGQGTMTCENIYCHGGTESMGGTNPQWNGNIACNSCHGTSAENTPPGYSHTTHVKEMKLECTVCHYTGGNDAGYNGHVNGRVNLEMNTPGWQGLTTYYDPDGSANLDGGIDRPAVVSWNSNPDGDDMPPSSQYGTCLNVACHYGNETPPWNNNDTPATCTTCHNDGAGDTGNFQESPPNTGYHEEHVHPAMAHQGDPPNEIAVSELMIGTFVNGCESCHGGGANTGDHLGHVNFQVDLGGGMTFNSGAGTCTSQCHSLKDSTGGQITWDLGAPSPDSQLACEACHMAPYLGPTVVDPDGENAGMPAGVFSPYGSHLQANSSDSFGPSTDWTSQCRKCHPYHDGTVAGVQTIPNPPSDWTNPLGDQLDLAQSLGINYSVTGGIHLGGTVASGGSEAEICWNCHGTNTSPKVSEWATPSMNGYTVIATNDVWSTAVFNAPGTQIPDRNVASIHTGNPLSGSSSVANNINASGVISVTDLEANNEIRCSYCHDVHDLNRAPKVFGGLDPETEVGQPYLRASWLPNPYPLERPPQNGDTYDNDNDWANYGEPARPRLYSNSVGSTRVGGYFIDQNSGWPTHVGGTPSGALMTVEETAGLCTLCHGNDVDNMNYYAASMWRPGQTNGHSNSTLGGSGSNKKNIFDGQRGKSGAVGTFNMAVQSSIGNNNQMGDTGDRAKNSGPLRNTFGTEPANGGQAPPRNTGWYGGTPGATSRGTEYTAWYSGNTNIDNTASIGTAGSNSGRAHDFPCSKCHTPHASGLPALLITNCLDNTVGTSGNAWTASGPDTIGPRVTTGLAATAQNNCHRKGTNRADGWHYLAPAQ